MKDSFTIIYQTKERKKAKFQLNDLLRVADLKKTFSKGDTNNWSYKLYKISEIINDTIPSYLIDNSPERYNEALLTKTSLTMKKKQRCYEKSKLRLNEIAFVHR